MTVGNYGSTRGTTRRSGLAVITTATFLLANACGGGRAKAPLAPSGRDPDAQVIEVSDSGYAALKPVDSGAPDALAPSVEFTAPTPASNPNDDTVVTDTTLVVGCKVTRSTDSSSSPINTSAVKITLEDPMSATKLIAPAVTAQQDGLYQATFDLSTFRNGPLRFHCEAKDLATTPHTGKATLDTLLDLGPTVTVSDPKPNGIYALGTPLVVQFQVDAAPLSDSDNEAAIAQVKVSVSGIDVPVAESTTMPGRYQTIIDFSDSNHFPVTPTATQLAIAVSDSRSPTAATRKTQLDIVIDGAGPSIRVTAPGNLSEQHGDVTLSVTVSDPSGIKVGSLKANVNGMLYDQWVGTAPNFSLKFDTTTFGLDKTQLTINVTAADTIGNIASAPSVVISLDNVPPIVSLDPPNIREYRMSGTSTACSAPFDPVGSYAANDLGTVVLNTYYRALVEDQTNHSPGSHLDYEAGLDPGSVDLYLQPDTTVPLLINTDVDKDTGKPIKGKESCDDIGSLDLKTDDPKRPIKLHMSAVTPTGVAWFPKDQAAYNPPGELAAPGWCTAGTDTISPSAICPTSEMTRVITARAQYKPPVVYAYAPSNNPSAGECTGRGWEQADIRVKAGWLCVAVRALDTIGNIGVSAPLRVCFDDGTHKPCDMAHIPTCTDGCPISDAQKYAPGQVWLQQ
jgi:hypothetical protein